MMIQCKDCRFWRTAERQGHFAPCGLHELPHGVERGDYDSWETDYRSPWMPDLGGCLGFEPRVAAEHWMYCKPRGRSFQSVPATKVVRVYGGLTLLDAKRWVDMCMALGRKQIAISLILKDFDGFRKEMATHGFEVRPALPPVAKKRKKHT